MNFGQSFKMAFNYLSAAQAEPHNNNVIVVSTKSIYSHLITEIKCNKLWATLGQLEQP